MTWALLGPSIVLLVQIEALLVVADALGAFDLGIYGHRTAFLVAVSVLTLVTAAQVSTWLWHAAREARGELLDRRRDIEAQLFSTADSSAASSRVKGVSVAATTPAATPTVDAASRLTFDRNWAVRTPAARIRRVAQLLPDDKRERSEAQQLARRFGFEPTWGALVLYETRVPAARQLWQEMQLKDARAAGHVAAVLVAVAAFAVSIATAAVQNAAASGLLLVIAALLLFLARGWGAVRSAVTFLHDERRFYPRLERLLELNRFDLYRSLALPAPRNATEEREHPLAEWRRGVGQRAYVLSSEDEDSDLRQQVTGLTDLLRGAELVAYVGFVSWKVHPDSIQLAFSNGAVLPDGNASLEVEGTSTATHAPFELTANSEDVALVQLRAAVQAPVDGRTARVTFDFMPRTGGDQHAPPVIWIEIRQRGRFIRLLRVTARPSTAQAVVPAPNLIS